MFISLGIVRQLSGHVQKAILKNECGLVRLKNIKSNQKPPKKQTKLND